MKLSVIIEYIQDLAHAFYQLLLKLSINAHQVITHWRVRINKGSYRNVNNNRSSEPVENTETNVELIEQNNKQSKTSGPSSVKTPRKLYSILRRLSLRNFMEYCVIAINEASSSGCSNKLDLTSCNQPVWLLGKTYNLPQDAELLIDDIRSRLWITYRRNFPPFEGTTRFTTDRGFGCMIRCGQMVLANGLLCKYLGRDWRWCPDGLESNPEVYTKVLKMFQDKESSPYSIHNIVQIGQQEGRVVGEWFGPNTIAQALKRLSTSLTCRSGQEESVANDRPTETDHVLISIDTALDNVVVKDEIKSRFLRNSESLASPSSSSSQESKWSPGILFIQLRLGLTRINPLYFTALKKTFQFKNSLGIIGGRPNHALYLVGHMDDDIIYLDPHVTQQYIDFDASVETGDIDASYHCTSPEKMPIDRLDPSLALCFYFHSEEDFDAWCQESLEQLIVSEQAPMFEITDSRPKDWSVPLTSTSVRIAHIDRSHNPQREISEVGGGNKIAANETVQNLGGVPKTSLPANDDEEFEMLG